MKVFFDMDDTLISTRSLVPHLFEIFMKPGLSDSDPELFSMEEAKEAYQAVYHRGYEGPLAQLEYMHTLKKFPLDKAKEQLEEVYAVELNESKIYPEVLGRLREYQNRGDEVFLITVGGENYQREKARRCGIEDIVGEDHCLYNNRSKLEVIKEIVEPNEPFVLIEDKIDTINEVMAEFPEARIIRAAYGSLMEVNREEIREDGEYTQGITAS